MNAHHVAFIRQTASFPSDRLEKCGRVVDLASAIFASMVFSYRTTHTASRLDICAIQHHEPVQFIDRTM